MHNNTNYQCKICWNKALTFGVGSIQLSFRIYIPLCSPNTCKYVFNPNVTTFQSNCAEGLHFSAFSVCVSVCLCVCFPYSGTSCNQAYKQQYQRLQRDTGMKYKKDFSLKRFVPKLWRRLLTSSSSGVVSGILVPFFRRN